MTSAEGSDIPPSRLLRDRVLFYLGVSLIIIGGPVLSLGSYAHDRYKIPLIGDAYDAFGWLNITYLAAGIVLFLVGLGLIALSLRGGIATRYSDPEGL
jgi:hypothetical protein